MRIRTLLVATACANLASSAISPAGFAQPCHPARATPALGVSVGIDAEVATAESVGTPAQYEGVGVALGWRSRRLGLRASIAEYRIDIEAFTTSGVGDAALDAELALLVRPSLRAGIALDTTLPTGNADLGLGMGHVMVMPGLWTSARRDRFSASVQASLGHAIGADAHHFHGGAVNVNPMNLVEAGGSLRLAVAATPRLAPHLAGAVALPLSDGGIARAVAGGGFTWRRGGWQLTGELLLALAGNPFHAHAAIGVARWI